VTPDGTVVWIYENPYDGGTLQDQGENSSGDIYKIEKYGPNYPAFAGLTLTGYGPVEDQNSLTDACSIDPNEAPNNASIISILNADDFQCTPELAPLIQVTNYGIGDITDLEIVISIDGAVADTIDWTGAISFQELADVQLPLYSFSSGSTMEVLIEIISVNGMADDAPLNNMIEFDLIAPTISEVGDFTLEISTDDWGNETGVRITNSLGWIVYEDQDWNDFIVITETINIPIEDCYEITVFDSWGDGIDPPYGVRLYDPSGVLVVEVSENDFNQIDRNFYVGEIAAELAIADFSFQFDLSDVDFIDNSTNAVTWSWDFGDGNTSTDESPSHTYAESGTYTVCLTVTNIDGVEDQTCQEITIESTNILENSIVEFSVYPNPATEILNLETDLQQFSYSVYDLRGKLLLSGDEKTTQITLSDFASGSYYIELISTNSEKAVVNFIKL